MAEYQTLIVERHGAVALVRIHRPDALNALNAAVLADLTAVFCDYERDAALRCLVLAGGERAFAAGADIKEMADQGFAAMYAGDGFAGWDAIARARKPWIAAVAGFALGGGCEVAMMADFIIAADSAQFGQPEIGLGIIPGMGGTQRLARLVGPGRAMELILTGRRIDAAEAERIGLVTRVVPQAELVSAALDTAARIAAMPPLAAMAAKEAVRAAAELPLSAGLQLERRLIHGLFATEDQKEGMAAFVAKRKPEWRGR